jgi:putative transposase
METSCPGTTYTHDRFPVALISHAVWLSVRFCLNVCCVEEMLLERGLVVPYEAIRTWRRKLGLPYAHPLRRRRPRPGDTWHMDALGLTSKGERHYVWRAVEQEGRVFEILVHRRRDQRAAKKCFRTLLQGVSSVPRVLLTDTRKRYAAKRTMLPGVAHRQHCSLNNRAENSHQPPRQRARHRQRCKAPGHAQRFLSASGPITHHFRPRRHRFAASAYRQALGARGQVWQEMTTRGLAAERRCSERSLLSPPIGAIVCNTLTAPPEKAEANWP